MFKYIQIPSMVLTQLILQLKKSTIQRTTAYLTNLPKNGVNTHISKIIPIAVKFS